MGNWILLMHIKLTCSDTKLLIEIGKKTRKSNACSINLLKKKDRLGDWRRLYFEQVGKRNGIICRFIEGRTPFYVRALFLKKKEFLFKNILS